MKCYDSERSNVVASFAKKCVPLEFSQEIELNFVIPVSHHMAPTFPKVFLVRFPWCGRFVRNGCMLFRLLAAVGIARVSMRPACARLSEGCGFDPDHLNVSVEAMSQRPSSSMASSSELWVTPESSTRVRGLRAGFSPSHAGGPVSPLVPRDSETEACLSQVPVVKRRRISSKRSDPPRIPIDGNLDVAAWKREWAQVLVGWEHRSQRSKYSLIYQRFMRWAHSVYATTRPNDPALEQWQKDCVKFHQKGIILDKAWVNPLKLHMLRVTSAPDQVFGWAEATWPPVEQFIGEFFSEAERRSASFLLTYNGDWGLMDPEAVKDLSFKTMDDVVEHLRKHKWVQDLFEELKAWTMEKEKEHKPFKCACALEICPDTWDESSTIRVHAHVFLMYQSRTRLCGKPCMWNFKGSGAHLDGGDGRAAKKGRNQHTSWAGMFYLTCGKVSTILSWTRARPYKDFPVRPQWIQNLLQKEQLTYAKAKVLLIDAASCTTRKLQDLERWKEEKDKLAIEVRVIKLQHAYKSTLKAFRVVPDVNTFLEKYSTWEPRPTPLGRKKICVLHGPTGLGKTEYVRSFFPVGGLLELNCADMQSVCLNGFDVKTHQAILWDEASAKLVVKNRKLFQHPLQWVDIGHSPTGQHVKRYWLNDCVSFVASNHWFSDLLLLSDDDRNWLEGNTVVVDNTEHLCPAMAGGA